MRPSELVTFLKHAIMVKDPVAIIGAPGLGKTDILKQTVSDIKYHLVISHPSVEDPTDSKGIPWGNGHGIDFQPVGQIKRVIAATEPTVWFLDDFGQAMPSVQAPYMQWLLGGECSGHKLPSCVTMVLASNRRTDRAGVTGFLEPVKSRVTFVTLEPHVDDWCAWMLQQTHVDGVAIPMDAIAEQVAFIRFRPDLLSQFQPSADLQNSPSPRNWVSSLKWLTGGLPNALELAGLTGRVGEGAAVERMGFRRLYRELPNIDGILIDPDKASIPTQPATLYAVVTALGIRANAKNFARVGRYAQRLTDAQHGEFAALLLRDATRRDQSIMQTPAFVKLASGDLGQLIAGGTS